LEGVIPESRNEYIEYRIEVREKNKSHQKDDQSDNYHYHDDYLIREVCKDGRDYHWEDDE
jgi:hypothetical protein